MNQKYCSREAGFSLLEYSLALAAILPIALGVIDLFHVLHGWASLRSSLSVALRCVYTADGLCTRREQQSSPRIDWYARPGNYTYRSYAYLYRGQESWLEAAHYTYDIHATVLDRGFYQVPGSLYQVDRERFGLRGRLRYALKTRDLPVVQEESGFRNFTFRDPQDLRRQVEPSLDVESSILLDSDSQRLQTTRPLQLPILFGNNSEDQELKCFSRDGQGNFIECQDSWGWQTGQALGAGQRFEGLRANQELHQYTYGILQVEGETEDSHLGASGGISITILYPDGTSRALGGQEIIVDNTRNKNFIPRGGYGNVQGYRGVNSGYENIPREVRLHEAIRMPRGLSFRLQFGISLKSGTRWPLRFRIRKIKIYTPHYELIESNNLECKEEFATRNQLPRTCEMKLRDATIPESLKLEIPQDIPDWLPLQPSSEIVGCFQSSSAARQYGLSIMGLPERAIPYAIGSCAQASESYPCPPDNRGIKRDSANLDKLMACPPPLSLANQHSKDSQLDSLHWSEKEIQLNPMHFMPTSCQEPEPSPERVNTYPQMRIRKAQVRWEKSNIRGVEDLDPVELLSRDQFNCSRFRSFSRELIDQRTNNEGSPIWIFGVWLPRSLGPDWKNVLKESAQMYGLDPSNYFTGTQEIKTVISPIQPESENYSVEFESSGPEFLIARDQEEGGEIPEICRGKQFQCNSRLRRFVELGTKESKDLISAAEDFGMRELTSAYPRARANSGYKHRAEITLEEDQGKYRASGSLSIPLMVLGNKEVLLQDTQERESERNYYK